MNRSVAIHKIAALIAASMWVAAVVAMVVNAEFWAAALPYILLCSAMAIITALVVTRHQIKQKCAPSYGSLITIPAVWASLFCVAPMFWEAFCERNWSIFTAEYWENAKGGFSEVIAIFIILWLMCLFPTAAVVLYYQRFASKKSDTPAPTTHG